MRVPLEGGGRLVVELNATEVKELGDSSSPHPLTIVDTKALIPWGRGLRRVGFGRLVLDGREDDALAYRHHRGDPLWSSRRCWMRSRRAGSVPSASKTGVMTMLPPGAGVDEPRPAASGLHLRRFGPGPMTTMS